MEHLNKKELHQRFKDVMANINEISVVDGETKIAPRFSREYEEGKFRWGILFTHLLEEYGLRETGIPSYGSTWNESDQEVPDPSAWEIEEGAKAIMGYDPESGEVLVKYGEEHYMKKAYSEGELRIQPATFYNDESLNPAKNDKELEALYQPPPDEMNLEIIDGITGETKGTLEPNRGKITSELPSDYYVYCLSTELDPRLFYDFDADACLLIRDLEEFYERIFSGIRKEYCEGENFGVPVTYYDPIHTKFGSIDIFRSKHFRYAYQKEFRILSLPSEKTDKLEFIDIEIEPFKDISELILLNGLT